MAPRTAVSIITGVGASLSAASFSLALPHPANSAAARVTHAINLAVGRTPWSAAGPLAGLLRPKGRTRGSGPDQGVRPTTELYFASIIRSLLSFAGLPELRDTAPARHHRHR